MSKNTAFLEHIQKDFALRTKKNPRFSIRSYARLLRIEPSSLAQILSSKRALTEKMCRRFAERLNLSPVQANELFKNGYSGSSATAFPHFAEIDELTFRSIADWYCYAILELTRVKTFKPKPQWIARALRISVPQATSAINIMKQLGYLHAPSRGRWADLLGSANNSGNQATTGALREHQRQILEKASEALELVPYEQRVQSSMVLSGSRERVAEAKRRCLRFIEELDEFMKSGDARDEVYAISVSLFPLSDSQHPTE